MWVNASLRHDVLVYVFVASSNSQLRLSGASVLQAQHGQLGCYN